LADAPLVGHRACQYEITPDMHFVMAPHPEVGERVWLLGGGSGHGFKHGPALAERFEPWLSGAAEPEPRFGLGDRVGDISLRTAGVRNPL
jgi:glycine/D-amino acid oxidase-like deaminating enzyme